MVSPAPRGNEGWTGAAGQLALLFSHITQFSHIYPYFSIFTPIYRTQVSLGSDLWVRFSQTDKLSHLVQT